MDKRDEYKRIAKNVLRGQKLLGSSVIFQNSSVLDEAFDLLEGREKIYLTGVKDTGQIDHDLLAGLMAGGRFVFHTIDKMARDGRAIDVELTNPLTGRLMTGSSSGGCINLLEGVNDLAIGTDGGGSVLAPALATNLFSIMAKGLGLQGRKERESTDRINFLPGIGFISPDYQICLEAVKKILNLDDLSTVIPKLAIGIPARGSVILPHGEDMAELLQPVIDLDLMEKHKFTELDLSGVEERKRAIQIMEGAFQQGVDLIITAEGPVDFYGYGDSVLGTWKIGRGLQEKSGKYLIRAANMVNATAVTIPTDRLSTGIVVIIRPGIEIGLAGLVLAQTFINLFQRPRLFNDYFNKQFQKRRDGFLKGWDLR